MSMRAFRYNVAEELYYIHAMLKHS